MTSIHQDFSATARYVVHHGDWRELVGQLPLESVDLTVTSPPYCIGKDYEVSRTVDDFRREHECVIPRIAEMTKSGGSICWQVGYHVKNGVLTPLDFIVHEIFSSIPDITLRNRIIWAFNSGLHGSRRLSGRHEVVLWYTKGKDYYFDLDAIRLPQRYPGKKHHKGTKRGQYSSNPRGKNPGDVWEIPLVKANSVEKTDHPCQFPVGLVQGLIKALSPPDGLVLDPYLGSGSTGAAAVLEARRFCGAELRTDYYHIAVDRVARAMAGDLRYRPYGTPIYVPAGKVAKRPMEFDTVERESSNG